MRNILAFGLVGLLAGPAFATDTVPMTRDNGAPIGDNQNSKVAGPEGPVVLEDNALIEKLARFDRERIPERVVHARGTGAQGVFVTSEDFSKYSKASVLGTPGKETPVLVRFSTVMNYRGSPEAARDPRGFAVKFYTDQGNWDIVGINEPVFFIRDAIKFPDFVHANKPAAVTNLQDPNNAFDFFSRVPESTHMLTQLYTDTIGMPASYRTMDGYGVHAFRLVNAKGQQVFAKFHWKSQQGLKGLTLEQMKTTDTDYATKDLYANIAAGNFPKWDLYVQLMTPEEVEKLSYDGFDDTKVWSGVPEVKVGTMTLNKVPANYFEYTEEAAFAPSNLVPGIEPSPDRMLQGRLFAYADTQRYRLGVNYEELPANRPLVQVANNNQDGAMQFMPRTGNTNFDPTNVPGQPAEQPAYRYSQYKVEGLTQTKAIDKQENFRQAGEFYRALSKADQDDLIKNLAADLGQVKNEQVKDIMVSHFYRADKDYGTRLAAAAKADVKAVEALADH